MRLSNTQKMAINHLDGPALVLAVPGSGKTTVIIHRTRKLIEELGIKPDRILSITFSRSSANDMRNRFVTQFPNQSSMPDFSTIHAFCFRIIRDYSRKKKVSYRLIEDDKETMNKYRIIKDINQSLYHGTISEEKLEAFLSYYGYVKNMMISPDSLKDTHRIEKHEFVDMFRIYEETKKKHNLLDFDDLLTFSYSLLVENPKALNYYRDRFDHIQLDEGQDTSRIQLELLKLLALPANNLFIVADDDQSIYGFRGAYPQGLLDFHGSYPKGKIFFMDNNYRSSKNIVNLSNSFIQQNKSRFKKTISTENPFSKAVQVVKLKQVEDQYSHILRSIDNSTAEKTAILYRNNISALGLLNFLQKNNKSFYMRDVKLKFFNHWLVNDVYNFIDFSLDSSNLVIYEQIYYKMKGYVSKKMINWLKSRSIGKNVFKELLKYPGLSDFYRKQILQLELDFRKIQRLSPAQAIRYIRNSLSYDSYLHENSLRFGYTYEQLKEILYYMEMIAGETTTFLQFKERMNELRELMLKSSKTYSNLTLSTIHSAKGLEFDNVFIIDLVEGAFPSASSVESMENGDISSYEEERRLFYVGMTRAKKRLDLLSYELMDDTKASPSGFLLELQTFSKH